MYDGDYENALAIFQDEADKGNVPAIYNIAKMYQRGQLGEENIPKAQEYYTRTLKGFLYLEASAGKMQPYVWYHIGKLYNLGYGTLQDYAEAFKWFQKAAMLNIPSAVCITTATELNRITRRHSSGTRNPPINTMPTLAMKLQRCFVMALERNKTSSSRINTSEKHTEAF